MVLKPTRDTKNAYRRDEAENDPPVGNFFVQKRAMPGGSPPELEHETVDRNQRLEFHH
ncbi:MAG: hypothetical protein OXR67_04030 [Chloroflexota bacterium]|nr:hypothetical protein [Chloroflexota bacterium]